MQIDTNFFPIKISGKKNDALLNTSYTNIADLRRKFIDDGVLKQ